MALIDELLAVTSPAEILRHVARATWAKAHDGAECPDKRLPAPAALAAWLPKCRALERLAAADAMDTVVRTLAVHDEPSRKLVPALTNLDRLIAMVNRLAPPEIAHVTAADLSAVDRATLVHRSVLLGAIFPSWSTPAGEATTIANLFRHWLTDPEHEGDGETLLGTERVHINIRLPGAPTGVRTVYLECGKGIPAHVAAVRRCMVAGIDVDRMRGRGIRDLFDYEWGQVVTDSISARLLGLIAHSRHRLTVHTLSQILSVDEDRIHQIVAQLPFLEFQTDSSCITFVSRTFADFAAEKLSGTKSDVLDSIVDYLRKLEDGDASGITDPLPEYYRESGRLEEVISFLSPKYFSDILRRSESFSPLRTQLEVGLEVASELRQDGQLVQFGLQCSAIREIESALVSRSEIEALVATEQGPEALALAAACPLREDRLHLLSVIARCERERGVVPSEEIADQIRHLFDQIDARHLGEKAIDIAADLYACFPDLAVDFVEQSSAAGRSENELDIAYFRLSIAAAVRQGGTDGGQDDLEVIRARIKNSRLRGFTGALSSRGESAEEIILEAGRLGTASDRLFFIRKWLADNSERADAMDVAEYGLRTLIESTAYAPNIRVLRELSTPLLFTADGERARSLVRSIEGQGSIIDDSGPTEEVVRLQLNLAVAESQFDFDACASRLLEVYLEVDAVTDLATKSSCLARCLVALRSVDTSGEIERSEGLTSLCKEELEKAIASLLDDTAQQVEVTSGIIGALASFDVDHALAVATSLNTAVRREEALLIAIDAILENQPDAADLESVHGACKRLRTHEAVDHVTVAIAEHLTKRHSAQDTELIEPTFELFSDSLFSVSDPIERCRVLCLLYGLTATGDYKVPKISDSEGRDCKISSQVL